MTPQAPVVGGLAPCPFCGGTGGYVECIDIGVLGMEAEWARICDCGARGPNVEVECGKDRRAHRQAIAAWNRRHPEPRASGEAMPRELGERIRTQNNRITSHPLFAVEQKRTVYGIGPQFDCENIAWLDPDGQIHDPVELAELEAEWKRTRTEPDGYTRTGYTDHWEFVTACFTEQGCKDYLAKNGHNLREPRIYAHSAYRNDEWIKLREFLLAAAPSADAGREGLDVATALANGDCK